MDLDWQDELEFGAQIYYRKIIDKFAGIPHYLACRLAKANLNRGQRLQHLKSLAERSAARPAKARRAIKSARLVLTKDDSESESESLDVLRNSNPIASSTKTEAISLRSKSKLSQEMATLTQPQEVG
jgi:hypothetical protein